MLYNFVCVRVFTYVAFQLYAIILCLPISPFKTLTCYIVLFYSKDFFEVTYRLLMIGAAL